MTEFNLEYFAAKKISFALIKKGRLIFQSKDQGLKPLIFCFKNHKAQMRGGFVFDKVVGRAAALLLVWGGVKKVLTPTVSRGGLTVLRRGGATAEYGRIVKNILNRAGDDLCPMEKLSREKPREFVKLMPK